MAKKNENIGEPSENAVAIETYVTYEIMHNHKSVPVSRPADFINLTPVVIPMQVTPYMAPQRQPAPKAPAPAGDNKKNR